MGWIRITDDLYINNDIVGFLGTKQPKWHRSVYDRWKHMWQRCRNPECKSYEDYKDCLIDDRYIHFSNYLHDVELLEDFNLLKENPSKYEIDKDKLDSNNRCYYFEHLSIITKKENIDERNSRLGNPNPPKGIRGINIHDGSIIVFKSMREASSNKYDSKCIRRCLKNKDSIYKDCKWEYIKGDDLP